MSSHPPSPIRRPQSTTTTAAISPQDSPLPQGQCRYLLLHPEVRGQRCACVGFSLNKCTPGSSCNCGHLAVYHLTAPTTSTSADKEEVETMRARIVLLEKLLEREREAKNHLTVRVSALEEHNEKGRFDADFEIRNVYRGIEGLWRHFGALDRRTRYHDDCIDALMDTSHATQDDLRTVQSRIIDLDDASMILEDRVDGLSPLPRRIENAISRRPSTTPPRRHSATPPDHPHARRSRSSQASSQRSSTRTTKAWTVHISLMPTASQPFPFEKDTMAYKRVQSRGLHRVVAVPGPDADSFVRATSAEFGSLLKGRPWMPLVAKICDAEHVTGLPMLRQLPGDMIDSSLYDLDFLTAHCATLDRGGHILDLYIGMCEDSFSWAELRSSPVFLPGLEACWVFDPFLDGAQQQLLGESEEAVDSVVDDLKAEDRHSAGDLLRAWSPPVAAARLKRSATGITRTSSFGSTDSAGSVSKKSKIGHAACAMPAVEVRDWRAEAVRGV
ncbi:hypothetical protein VE03_07479 [Pseudogymnoascus sp. 23342-1-I1]|nr:hypothetical protein VE03_07479 [Pseudogymnoascus sp. 23342-1-I1]